MSRAWHRRASLGALGRRDDRLDARGDLAAEPRVVAALPVADIEVGAGVEDGRRILVRSLRRQVAVEQVVAGTAVQDVVPECPDQQVVPASLE